MSYDHLKESDPKAFLILKNEDARQHNGLELIPSENYVSQSIHEACASMMTNKYSEGYPGRRYYGGQEFTDQVEQLAIDRACELFNCTYANVQPHSGAQANTAVYFALAKPGDTILGMDLSAGGHLTHGHPMTHSAQVFNFVNYGIKDAKTGEIDYEEVRRLAHEHKPKIILCGFSSYTRSLDYARFVEIAKEVGAFTVADMAHIAGLIVAGVLKNPFDAGFDVITTTTHKTLRGPRGGMILIRDGKKIFKKVQKSVFPGMQGGPLMHQIAAKAVAFGEALKPGFKTYAQNILDNTKAMEDAFRAHGVDMVFGGSENHMLLINTISSFKIPGKEAQNRLDEIGITLNMNVIPDDERGALDPSGIRLGTPALTTRGFTGEACKKVVDIIVRALKLSEEDFSIAKTSFSAEVKSLAQEFPIPENF